MLGLRGDNEEAKIAMESLKESLRQKNTVWIISVIIENVKVKLDISIAWLICTKLNNNRSTVDEFPYQRITPVWVLHRFIIILIDFL